MKTKVNTTILAVIALVLFGTVGTQAHAVGQDAAPKPMQHDMSTMDMSSMMKGPHHALAMAYMQNIGTFAKALQSQAEASAPLDVKFARIAVSEMRRSLDLMRDQRREHMKMMSEDMRTKMAPMMKVMDTHLAMLTEAVSALENDVKGDHPDSKQVAADSANVLKHLDEMMMMHNDADGMKMKM